MSVMFNQATSADNTRRGTFLWGKFTDYWTIVILILIVTIFGLLQPKFLSLSNWVSTTTYMTETLLLAIAETYVIVTAGIDLSVGAIEGLAGIVGAMVMLASRPLGASLSIWCGIVSGLCTGVTVGFVNGFVITKMKITPFIVTLGTMGIATGITFILSGGTDVVGLPSQLTDIGNTVLFGIVTFPVLITLVVLIISWIWLKMTRFGQYTYAVGSNEEAARRAGINVNRHLLKVYVLAGLIAGVSGVLLLTRFGTGSPLTGGNAELNAIAAVVIGGTSLFGGRGSLFGTLVGAAIISILITGLVILDVQSYWQMVATGAIIIAAVFVDQLRSRLK